MILYLSFSPKIKLLIKNMPQISCDFLSNKKFNNMKKVTIIIILITCCLDFAKGQNDTIVFFYGINNKVVSVAEAIRCIEVIKYNNKTYKMHNYLKRNNEWFETTVEKATLLNDSTLQIKTENGRNTEEIINRYFTRVDSCFYFTDINGKGIEIQSGIAKTLLPLYLIGDLKLFLRSGNIYRIEKYENNQMIGNQNWLDSGDRYIDDYYFQVDTMPGYPGGEDGLKDFIARTVRYPIQAQEKGIQGQVFVSFIVDEEGIVTGARIARGIQIDLDKEALRVVRRMKKWRPGVLNGKRVKVILTIPINFILK